MAKCVMEGCDKEAEIREYCQTCYNRLWKVGELPEKGKKPNKTRRLSSFGKPRRSLSERREQTATKIRTSYEYYVRNYEMCTSVDMRMHWRMKMNECLRQAERAGLSEEDLRLTPEEEEERSGDFSLEEDE